MKNAVGGVYLTCGLIPATRPAKLAKEAYEATKQTQQDECKKRGVRCRAAEDAVAAARANLATSAPVQSADPGAERLAAVLGIQPSTVQLYAPLLLPLVSNSAGSSSLRRDLHRPAVVMMRLRSRLKCKRLRSR